MSSSETAPGAATPAVNIADPGPLGLAGFAATTWALSMVNAGWLSEDVEKVVIPLAFFYGGLAQLLAGMWEFRKGNTFGATAFSTYGPFWLAFALYIWQIAPDIPEAQAAAATGTFLLVFAIFTGYMAVAALKTTTALLVVFVTLFVTYLLLTIAEYAGAAGLGIVGGYIGLITALAAWYASFAGVVNGTFGRKVMPVGPRT